MKIVWKNKYLIAIVLFVLFRIYVYKYLPGIINYSETSLLALNFFQQKLFYKYLLIVFSDFGNLILIFLIGNKIFGEKVGFYSAVLYAICPWIVYFSISGSVSVTVLFLLLLIVFGVINYQEKKHWKGIILLIVGFTGILYSSLFLYPAILAALLIIIKRQVLLSKHSKLLLVMLGIFWLPLVFIFVSKPLIPQENLFTNIGLINSINTFRGIATESGFSTFGRIIDNKYTYFGRHLLFNTLKHFSPALIFSPQEKLLGFSFSPPVYVGFIYPFLLGVGAFYEYVKKRTYLILVFILLLLPSIISPISPDLDKLIIISPIFFYTISYGLVKGINSKKLVICRLTQMSVCLVIFQIIVSLSDIAMREPIRFIKLFQQ